MTTDIAVLERAVIVMAICMAIQTALMVGVAIAAFIEIVTRPGDWP